MATERKVLTRSAVVMAVRDGLATTKESIAQILRDRNLPPGRYSSALLDPHLKVVGSYVRELVAARILVRSKKGTLTVSPEWDRMYDAMHLSLSVLDGAAQQNAKVVFPYFGQSGDSVPVDVFVLMSFDEALKPVYFDHIAKVVRDCGLTVRRADDFFTAHHVMSDVWTGIVKSRVIVADCTGRNPNVFYEIGIAHTVGKPVILIVQSEEDVPFDLRSTRFIKYSFTPRGMVDFENTLRQTLATVLGITPELPPSGMNHQRIRREMR